MNWFAFDPFPYWLNYSLPICLLYYMYIQLAKCKKNQREGKYCSWITHKTRKFRVIPWPKKNLFCYHAFKSNGQQVGNVSTLHQTNPSLNHSLVEGFWKHFGERRKCWSPTSSRFSKIFWTLWKTNLLISAKLLAQILPILIRLITVADKELKLWKKGF